LLQQFVPLSDISQGSEAAHLRCGGIFSDGIIADFILILSVKQFRKWLIFDKITAYKKLPNFWGHPVCSDVGQLLLDITLETI